MTWKVTKAWILETSQVDPLQLRAHVSLLISQSDLRVSGR
jgi:hypothetical protein